MTSITFSCSTQNRSNVTPNGVPPELCLDIFAHIFQFQTLKGWTISSQVCTTWKKVIDGTIEKKVKTLLANRNLIPSRAVEKKGWEILRENYPISNCTLFIDTAGTLNHVKKNQKLCEKTNAICKRYLPFVKHINLFSYGSELSSAYVLSSSWPLGSFPRQCRFDKDTNADISFLDIHLSTYARESESAVQNIFIVSDFAFNDMQCAHLMEQIRKIKNIVIKHNNFHLYFVEIQLAKSTNIAFSLSLYGLLKDTEINFVHFVADDQK